MNIPEQHHKYKEQIIPGLISNEIDEIDDIEPLLNLLEAKNINYYLYNIDKHAVDLIENTEQIPKEQFVDEFEFFFDLRFSGAEKEEISYYAIHFIFGDEKILTIAFKTPYEFEIYPDLVEILKNFNPKESR